MTHEQAKEQAERDVYFSNVGELMVMCDRRGSSTEKTTKGCCLHRSGRAVNSA